MTKSIFQMCELAAYLGDFVDDYDIDAIVEEATEIDYSNGNRYWIEDIRDEDFAEIVRRNELPGVGA